VIRNQYLSFMNSTDEIRKLQGSWVQVECEADGIRNSVDEFGAENITTISGNNFSVTRADGSLAIKGTFKLNLQHSPKHIDWTDTFGTNAGKTFPAIYTLDGDTFTFCAGDEGARPDAFLTRKNQVRRVLRRVKR
jgi:uncharacterized protein (TIGR03067 family)